MTKALPSLFGLSIENIKQKIEDMITIGYTEAEVIKMTKALPSLFGYSIENIKQKINDMIALGYTKIEVIEMTKVLPSLFSYSIENIKQKVEDMITLGYTKVEVIKMTKTLPPLFGLNIENIKQKIEFYKLIDIDRLLINDAKRLMQSIELSYARYKFYESRGIEISDENYRKLFIGQKQFENAYGIGKKELLEMYDYDEFIKQSQNQKLKIYNS